MNNQSYFYQFLEPLSKELAHVARELENSIFSGPRTMLTHARVFVENILIQVISAEKLPDEPWKNLKERLDLLNENGYLTAEVRDALHHVRRIGNQAAHDSRQFRYSEALLSWEEIYKIVKWYAEVYGPIELSVPDYKDPAPQSGQTFDSSELEERLKALEELLKKTIEPQPIDTAEAETAVTIVDAPQPETPGFTTIRTLTYKDRQLEVPYFLRDAFLLPQRFDKSENFLIRLGGEQQARLVSELPNDFEGLHEHVKRYNETNDENLFHELKMYIQEEKTRRKLKLERPGELFFFYQADHVVVTENLANLPITTEQFTGFPSLIQQLSEQGYHTVGQLPNELVTLAKHKNVGKGTLEKFFEQLKGK